MSPQPALQPQGHHRIVQGASMDDIEPFPEYTEPLSSTIYDTLADRNDEEHASADVFAPMPSSESNPTPISKAFTQEFNSWVSSLPRRSNEKAEKAKEQAYEGTSYDSFHRTTNTDYLREPSITLEEMHALFAQLEEDVPTSASADPVLGSIVADISSHDLQLPPYGVGGVNLEPQDDDLQMTQTSKDGGVYLRFGERVPLQGIRGVTDVVDNNSCHRSLTFRDSAIHMEDECAEACVNVLTHASPQPNHSLLNCHVTNVRPPDLESNPMHADIGDGGKSAKATFPTCHDTDSILWDIWFEEEQRGTECLEHAHHGLEGFVYLSAAQQAREDMLMLFSDQAEKYVWNAFPKGMDRTTEGASSNKVDRIQAEATSGEDRGLLGTSRMIDPFQNFAPGYTPKRPEIDDTAPHQTINNPQQVLLSPLPLSITPANAQQVGRHLSQGLLTPSYSTIHLTLPNKTPKSPCAEVKKPKRTYKKRPRPNTRKQALAEAEAFDNVPDVNKTIETYAAQSSQPPHYLLTKMAKPNNIVPQGRIGTSQQANTPTLPPTNCLPQQDLIVPPLPLTPGDTTESQESMTPDPHPSPNDFLTSAEPAPPPPPSRRSANKQKGSANKRRYPKRTRSNRQDTTGKDVQGEKHGKKRKSGRLVKKMMEKVKA